MVLKKKPAGACPPGAAARRLASRRPCLCSEIVEMKLARLLASRMRLCGPAVPGA